MQEETLTRAHLAEAVFQQVGLSRQEAGQFVDIILEELSEALVRGDTVKMSGFGTFAIRQKGERVGRNPKTGVEVTIKPRRVLSFRASHILKDRINGIATTAREDDE